MITNNNMGQGRIWSITNIKNPCFFLVLLSACFYIYHAYQQFWVASWTFDGGRIFYDLNNIGVSKTAVDFIFDAKEISPIGRPLSLATFLLNIGDWPNNPAGFRKINTLIHLINILLLTLVGYRLANIIPNLVAYKIQFAVVFSVTWGMHPFLASTSFHIVQRMTLLSATFSLLAFLTYLIGRDFLSTKSIKGYWLMSFGIIIFGGLGILSKENALLIPLLIGATEFSLLSHYRPITTRFFFYWKLFFFGLPALILIIYSGYYLATYNTYFIRHFSLSERIFSESIILFRYVAQLLFPQIKLMGPFQDDLSHIASLNPITLITSITWIILIITAFFKHRKWPIFSFIILFFLTAHLLESTIFNLELYFEHRNYLASMSIIGPFVGALWASRKRSLQAISFLYSLLLAGLLWSICTLWGNPILAPITWAENHPSSVRAAQVFTTMLWKTGNIGQAHKAIDAAYLRMPLSSELATNALTYACFSSNQRKVQQLQANVIKRAPKMHYGRTISKNMFTILKLMESQKCPLINPKGIVDFLYGLLSNPRFANQEQRFAFLLLINRFALLEDDHQTAAIAHMQGYKIKPWKGGLETVYCELLESRLTERAHIFLNEHSKSKDTNTGKGPVSIHACEGIFTKTMR